MTDQSKEIVIRGTPVSPGIAIGTALVMGGELRRTEERSIRESEVESEIERFRQALVQTRDQIEELQKRVQSVLNDQDAKIFDAHLLIVDDKILTDDVEKAVRREKKSVDFIFQHTIERYIAALSTMEDKYIRERAVDIRDVANRIISNLHGKDASPLDHLPGQRIILAHDLSPSDTAMFDRENVQAFATEAGSRTSHTAIMARSMEIPAVVGAEMPLLESVKNGDLSIVDGYTGHIIINPDAKTLKLYAEKETRGEKLYADMIKESRLRPETVDGFQIQLVANLELPEDIGTAQRHGAGGVGLFRTEYLFTNPADIPNEEQQFEIYREIAAKMGDKPVIIRSLDIGGDKLPELTGSLHEMNPFLGCRAIRLWRDYPKVFETQLRAILRASAFGNIKIMFPMLCCREELQRINESIDASKAELQEKKISFNRNIEIGIMVETPSAAIIADILAPHVDFFSIGTNDLVQYTMAVDRTNEKIAYLYQPSHPAIIHLIEQVANAARKHGIWVSVCGEMAGDPRYTPLLVGLGIQELSMSPVSIGPIRRLIRRMRMHQAEETAREALLCHNAQDALAVSEKLLYKIAPDIMSITFHGE